MAGDWIKIELVTPSKPEIDAMAEILSVSVNEVIGGLVRLWIWADTQTIDGNAPSVTKCAIDRHSGVPGLSDAMLADHVGWLKNLPNGGFVFPNFDRHNGQTAKRRALTAKRKATWKERKGNAASVTGAFPREEKRREEKKKKETKKSSSPFAPPTQTELTAFVAAHKLAVDPSAFLDHYTACGWKIGNKAMRDWQAAARQWSRRSAEFSGTGAKPLDESVEQARKRIARTRAEYLTGLQRDGEGLPEWKPAIANGDDDET